jgi:hypothetical protein
MLDPRPVVADVDIMRLSCAERSQFCETGGCNMTHRSACTANCVLQGGTHQVHGAPVRLSIVLDHIEELRNEAMAVVCQDVVHQRLRSNRSSH